MKYRKKPVVIDAWPARTLSAYAANNWPSLPPQIKAHYGEGNVIFLGDGTILINTLEGQHTARPDDMVICGVHGELYPCKPDIFEKTYEAADE